MRPLERIPSLKLKLSIVIVAAVAVTATTSTVGFRLGVPLFVRPVISAALALAMVQFLAHGMTRPLRDMEQAAAALARGDYRQRVETKSVDEVGRLADAFNRMAGALAASERQQRDLIANVSHELRTPVTGLQAMLENVIDGVVTPTPETFQTMHSQVDRLGRLVRDLLDLSRLESGTTALDIALVPLEPLLRRIAEESRLHHPGIDLHVDVRPGDARVWLDEHRMQQVLVNLLDNAARYTGDDGRIDLRAEVHDDRLRLEVTDNGPGIAPEDRAQVFERFYRADSARAQHSGGAGLGLAIVQWIIDLHGGTVTVDENLPHGCRMRIDLPRARVIR